jgi:CheY-like chemotaxis protein
MRVLIADEDPVSREMQICLLQRWGHEVIAAQSGARAWAALNCDNPHPLAILDWSLSQIDGNEICRRVRATPALKQLYVLLLTPATRDGSIGDALAAGADDCLAKPFKADELNARVKSGVRFVQLQAELKARAGQLQESSRKLAELRSILPLCGYCKRIRNDQNYWHRVEAYFDGMINAEFDHGLCPECYESVIRPQLDCMGISLDSRQYAACSCRR